MICAPGGGLPADAEVWAAELGLPAYALDDQSAIKVTGEEVEVVSEGSWHHLLPG